MHGLVFCGVVIVCSLNVNTPKFALSPLWMVCLKKLMVSLTKLDCMPCLRSKVRIFITLRSVRCAWYV